MVCWLRVFPVSLLQSVHTLPCQKSSQRHRDLATWHLPEEQESQRLWCWYRHAFCHIAVSAYFEHSLWCSWFQDFWVELSSIYSTWEWKPGLERNCGTSRHEGDPWTFIWPVVPLTCQFLVNCFNWVIMVASVRLHISWQSWTLKLGSVGKQNWVQQLVPVILVMVDVLAECLCDCLIHLLIQSICLGTVGGLDPVINSS